MQPHLSTTPFGRRSLALAHVATQATAKLRPPDKAVHKWQVFRAVCTAKARIGASERALAVLDAQIHLSGPKNDRVVAIGDYHRLPGDEAWRDTVLESGELITAIELPAETFADHYTYLKLRDRLSYAFALVSVAVVMRMNGGGIEEARVALGGVAHKPWRNPDAEALLRGQASDKTFTEFADALLAGATGQGENNFKIPLARRAIVRACHQAANGTPQSQTDKRIV